MIEYQIKHIFPLLLLAIQHEKYHFLLTLQKHFNHSLSYRFSLQKISIRSGQLGPYFFIQNYFKNSRKLSSSVLFFLSIARLWRHHTVSLRRCRFFRVGRSKNIHFIEESTSTTTTQQQQHYQEQYVPTSIEGPNHLLNPLTHKVFQYHSLLENFCTQLISVNSQKTYMMGPLVVYTLYILFGAIHIVVYVYYTLKRQSVLQVECSTILYFLNHILLFLTIFPGSLMSTFVVVLYQVLDKITH